MARGQRKSLDTKILEKEQIIFGLKAKIQSEEKELKELKEEQKNREVEAVLSLLEENNMEIGDLRTILSRHMDSAIV